MSEIYTVPIKYKEGTYYLKDMIDCSENVINMYYEEFGESIAYEIPNKKREITLYGIPKCKLEETLKAVYIENGQLKSITVNAKNKEMLLYICYEEEKYIKKQIQQFAVENAENIIEKIIMCKDIVSRLFVEYFSDGEYMDFHVKIGTKCQKDALEKKCFDVDSAGNYEYENIQGDNDKLKVMVFCAGKCEIDFFQFAVDSMTKYIKEKALKKLNKANDFKFLCVRYD